MNSLKRTALLFLFFYLPVASMAWGVLGHRIVGQIAESYLTPAAKTAITKILGTESIAMAANWADFIKSDSNFAYLSPWHYTNIPGGLSKQQVSNFLDADTTADAYTKLNLCIQQLKNKQLAAKDKLFYLRLLIHITGDIHQPLHVRLEEQGGNLIKLTWFGAASNLHRVWDESLINFQQLSYTEYTSAINHTTAAQRAAWQKSGLKGWIYDSYLASEQVYASAAQDDKLGYEYNFKFVSTVNEQLLKGGVRLAGLLNEIFSSK